MLYDKLPVVFLTHLASQKQDATNSQIANYLLNHLNDVKSLGIKDIADECHVAVSSISRFCKEIGLRDFNELREMIASTHLSFNSSYENINQYTSAICHRLNMLAEHLNLHQIHQLCVDLKQYENVAIFGLLKAGAVCLNLQTDLLMLGKRTYTTISYKQQIEYIKQATNKHLILIFSYTGTYFEYHDLRALHQQLKKAIIWFISSEEKNNLDFVDETIYFPSYQDELGHPYQLQLIAGIIGQEYAQLTKQG